MKIKYLGLKGHSGPYYGGSDRRGWAVGETREVDDVTGKRLISQFAKLGENDGDGFAVEK